MQFDLIIIGGGLAGLSLACGLRETRLKIALIENHPPRPAENWDARIYAISPANAEFLKRIGVWRHLDLQRVTPVHAMRVFGDGGGELVFSAYESGVDELAFILESSRMACELWENAKRQANLSLFCPATPGDVSIGDDTAQLVLADGRTLSAKLLVGADGRDSWLRNQVGLAAIDTPYHEKGVVANFECETAHQNTAYQWFRDDGVLAWLPLPGKRISMVWSTPDPHAAELLALAPDALCARVSAAGTHTLGALRAMGEAQAFPLHLLRVPQRIARRVALIGDAAHGIHPLSGHGVNLGFGDASVLAGLLAEAPDWEDIGADRRLRAYQRERREETELLQHTTHTLRQLFRETLPGLKILRNAGMELTGRLPVVKNLLVRYALAACRTNAARMG